MKNASLQKIIALDPIEGADRIEKASVLGWQTVVIKGAFKVGDFCVFIPVDTIVPDKPPFAFLKDKNFRIRKAKMKGCVSQGVAMPLSDFATELAGVEVVEGADVSEQMGVTHYEKPIPYQLAGMAKGSFPAFIKKTDEERLQNIPGILIRHLGKEFVYTEKINGTSTTFFLNEGVFGVCSRNLELTEHVDNGYWKMARKLNLEELLKKFKMDFGSDLTIQGEMYGNGICGNHYNIKDVRFACFNIFDITHQKHFAHDTIKDICVVNKIDMVPELGRFIMKPEMDVKYFEELAKGRSVINKDVKREGCVFRPVIECVDPETGSCSYKMINPEHKED